MEINTEKDGGTVVASPTGRLDGSNAREFQDALDAVVQDTERALILDFEQVSYISSAGLRVLLVTAKTLQGNGAELALCSLDDPIREVFGISGFDSIIPIHSSRAEAIAAVQG